MTSRYGLPGGPWSDIPETPIAPPMLWWSDQMLSGKYRRIPETHIAPPIVGWCNRILLGKY